MCTRARTHTHTHTHTHKSSRPPYFVSHTDFDALGCILHILNLMLQGGYQSAFGGPKMNVMSAVRLGFMLHYLMDKYPNEWKEFLKGLSVEALMAVGASLGRWWSIIMSFKLKIRKYAYLRIFSLTTSQSQKLILKPDLK